MPDRNKEEVILADGFRMQSNVVTGQGDRESVARKQTARKVEPQTAFSFLSSLSNLGPST